MFTMTKLKMISLYLLAIIAIAAGSLAVAAQTRIRFKRGSSSITLTGQLSSKKLAQAYIIGASAGQRLIVCLALKRDNGVDFVNISVHSPSGEPLISVGRDECQIYLPENGNYKISLEPPGSFYREKITGYKQLRYSLFIQINK